MLMSSTMEQNKEILDRLLVEQKQSSREQHLLANDDQVLITTARVVNIRYRLYFLVLLVIGGLFAFYIAYPAWNVFDGIRQQYSSLSTQILSFTSQKAQMDADKALIAKMESQEPLIVSCLNSRIGCKEIDADIQKNFSFARSFIQLNNLSESKAVINEKVLLANINEYLLKDAQGNKNGKLNFLHIGEPQHFEGNLYMVPVNLSVDFDNKDVFLSFLDNVETKIVTNPAYRVLYKVANVSYDITHYSEKQTVGILLNAYYYQD